MKTIIKIYFFLILSCFFGSCNNDDPWSTLPREDRNDYCKCAEIIEKKIDKILLLVEDKSKLNLKEEEEVSDRISSILNNFSFCEQALKTKDSKDCIYNNWRDKVILLREKMKYYGFDDQGYKK